MSNKRKEVMRDFNISSASYGTRAAYGSHGIVVQSSIERHAILGIISRLKFRNGIDLGCGPGRYLRSVGSQHSVVGIDISRNMARAAKASAEKSEILVADMEETPFRAACFQLVYSIRAMKYLGNQTEFVRETKRLCAPGGSILLYDIWSTRNIGHILSQRFTKLKRTLPPPGLLREVPRTDHHQIKRLLEGKDGCRVSVRGILFLPQLLYSQTSSPTLLRVFTLFERLLSRFPLSQYLSLSVFYIAAVPNSDTRLESDRARKPYSSTRAK